MTNIEIVKMLINALDSTGIQDEAIKRAALALLDVEEPKPKPKKASVKSTQHPAEKKPGTKKEFDTGKMNALLKAGWSVPKIADEMGVSDPTVRKYMKQEGYR